MSEKKRKFYILKNTHNFLKENESKILVIAQYTNYNKLSNLDFFKENIKFKTLKINTKLINKLTCNSFITSLYNGNTVIFAFSNLHDLYSFIENKSVKEKVIPLVIFWKNKLYSYSFIKNIVFKNIIKDSNYYSKSGNNLLVQLGNPINSLIKVPVTVFSPLFKLLKLLKDKS